MTMDAEILAVLNVMSVRLLVITCLVGFIAGLLLARATRGP